MKATIDGNAICITGDHFVNLQESEAVFFTVPDPVERLKKRDVLQRMFDADRCLAVASGSVLEIWVRDAVQMEQAGVEIPLGKVVEVSNVTGMGVAGVLDAIRMERERVNARKKDG